MDIEILGRITRVNCPAGQEQALQSAADELNKRLDDMKKRTQVNNAEQLLAIAALNAFYELDSLTKEAEKTQVISEKLSKMSKVLDDALDAVITKPFQNKQAISPVDETSPIADPSSTAEQNNVVQLNTPPSQGQ